MLGLFLDHSTLFTEAVCLLPLSCELDYSSKPTYLKGSHLYLPSAGIIDRPLYVLTFSVDARDPNVSLHACVTSTMATESSFSFSGSLSFPHNASCLKMT